MARKRTRRNHGYTVNSRKDGRWGWAVTTGYDPATGNPQRIQGTCRTQADATAKALAVLAKVKQGAPIPEGRDKQLAAYLQEWLEIYVRPHREPKTVAYYEAMIRLHIVPTLGRIPLRRLTAKDVQQLLNEKSKKPTGDSLSGKQAEKVLSPETIRGIKATLRSALSRAQRDGLVSDNVATRVETPKANPKKVQFLQPAEVTKLLEALNGHPLSGLVTLTLLTGMRIGEASGLKWEYIDFEKKSVRIAEQLQRVNGKLQLKRLKSDRANRTLHLSDLAVEILQQEKAKHLLSSFTNEMNLVFLNPTGGPLDPKYVDANLKRVMQRAGIEPMSFHKLRHTAATLALASGIPLVSVRDQLGHSQIALTANIYGHAVPTALQNVGEALSRIVTNSDP